jgi:2-keto-3-deoxy-L-rhamnonate aldolase RhmA
MTDLKKDVIIKHVFDLNARAFPPRIANMEAIANLLRATRHAPPVGTRWASKFVARRPKLKTRWNRSYDYQRA